MTLAVAIAVTAFGIAVLLGGGECLVRGAVSIARLLRVSPAIIGLTIVAVGTSAPELSVSLVAALRGQPDIAVGNVVGSNIFNIAIILGAAALLMPLTVHVSAVRLEWPIMFVTMFVALLLTRDGLIDRLEGGFLLVALIAFLAYMVHASRTEVSVDGTEEFAASVHGLTVRPRAHQAGLDILLVIAGLVLLAVGARFLVIGASDVARTVGVSERVIGLTIAAAGTSMPELAASLAAARRRQPDIALANVLGSNIFNVLGILGIVSVVTPQTVHPQIVASDVWWMLGLAGLLFPLMMSGRRLTRWEGAVLLATYGLYLWFLL